MVASDTGSSSSSARRDGEVYRADDLKLGQQSR